MMFLFILSSKINIFRYSVIQSRRQDKFIRNSIGTVANLEMNDISKVRPCARGESASPDCMQHPTQQLHGNLSNSVIVSMYILMYRSSKYVLFGDDDSHSITM